ncbi:dual specificity protein phosphatase 3-like [Spea bombifrons]|uniref:dual specificity protein phosphatase 3-like n=1 Tax=Spea bombifrons TaxID=233779 RepID=UPI00234B40D7|nr:dual specificity protein phosphatase 3-like [Spea bombifrons]
MSEYDISVQALNELLTNDDGFYSLPSQHFNEVYRRIYVGDAFIAQNKMRLQRLGITHILNAAEGSSLMHVDTNNAFYSGTNIRYHGIKADDRPNYDLSSHFEDASDYIDKALSQKNGQTISDPLSRDQSEISSRHAQQCGSIFVNSVSALSARAEADDVEREEEENSNNASMCLTWPRSVAKVEAAICESSNGSSVREGKPGFSNS